MASTEGPDLSTFSDPNNLKAQQQFMHDLETTGSEALGATPPDIEEYWTTITAASGWSSRTFVARPKPDVEGRNARSPLIVLFHGGGYVVGSPRQLLRPARDFAQKFGAVVVCPSYKLAPEHPWPEPQRSGWEVVEYLSHHAEGEFGADLDRGFVLGGFSAGGGIAAVVAGLAVFGDAETTLAKPLTGLFLGVPHLLEVDIVPGKYTEQYTGMEENSGPVAEGMKIALRYLNCTNHGSVWFSPVNHFSQPLDTGKIAEHPPTYLNVGQLDALRDDGLIYEKLLREHGVATKLDVFPEDGHVAWTAVPNPTKSTNPTVEEATLDGTQWLLSFSTSN
jgi:acetyl esterase/lipase